MHDNYKKANSAPRCVHQRRNGLVCTQPALRGRAFCRFHDPIGKVVSRCHFPILEDASSLQVSYTEIISALLAHKIDKDAAELCFQALRLASVNLKRFQEEMNFTDRGSTV
jgi:hypothetical protein